MTTKALTASDLVFRNISMVALGIVPFGLAYSVAWRELDKLLPPDTKKNIDNESPLSAAIGGVSKLLGAKGDQRAGTRPWDTRVEDAASRWLIIGASFSVFGVAYNWLKNKYDQIFNGVKPESLQPEASGDAVKDFFNRGTGRLIFRDVASTFLSAIAFGVSSSFLGSYMAPKLKDNPNLSDDMKRYLAMYVPAATGFVGYFTGTQEYRKAYDKFWENWGKKKQSDSPGIGTTSQLPPPPAGGEKRLAFQGGHLSSSDSIEKTDASQEKASTNLNNETKDSLSFYKDGLGKVLFSYVPSIMIGFAPHQYLKMRIMDMIGTPDKANPDPATGKILFKEGTAKMPGLSQKLNEVIKASPTKLVDAVFFQEVLATGGGFMSYIATGDLWRNTYDRIIDALGKKHSKGINHGA